MSLPEQFPEYDIVISPSRMAQSWADKVEGFPPGEIFRERGEGPWSGLEGTPLLPLSTFSSEPRTGYPLTVFGTLSIWLSPLEGPVVHAELFLIFSNFLTFSLVNCSVEEPDEVALLAKNLWEGFQQAMRTLEESDAHTLLAWAAGTDAIRRLAATTHPACPEEGKVAAYLGQKEKEYSGLISLAPQKVASSTSEFFADRIVAIVCLASPSA